MVDSEFECFFQGRDVILTCEIFGFPRPGIVFTRDGNSILGIERITNINLDQVCAMVSIRACMEGVPTSESMSHVGEQGSANTSLYPLHSNRSGSVMWSKVTQ